MEELAVVIVPFPAQGHLNPLLHLSLLLSSRGLPVHYAASSVHTRQARSRIQGWPPECLSNVHFLDIPIPAFPSPPPDPSAPTSFPIQLLPAFEASVQIRAPLVAAIRSLSAAYRRVVIVQDPLMGFAGADASELGNVEIYSFVVVPAFFQLPQRWDKESAGAATPEARAVIEAEFEDIFPDQLSEFAARRYITGFPVAGVLINTCRQIEGEFIDLYQQRHHGGESIKIYAVGPLNPLVTSENEGETPRHECLEWLDRQPERSVVYVSFGSTCTMPLQQIEELAAGLKSSGQRFIWVLRDADRGDIFSGGEARGLLPGFEQEVEGVGMVVRGWAPQLEILAHAATGAFMSHCGWNSCLESLSMGVPVLAWPMYSDQPMNAMVLTEYLQVGFPVREWARRKEMVTAAEVADAVKKMIVYDEGKEVKRKVKELCQMIRGASRADLDSFVAQITR